MNGAGARLASDLEEILEASADDLRAFTGKRLFMTGATGFVGTWLLWTVVHANRRLRTAISVDALTRDPAAFAAASPELAANSDIHLVSGDVCRPILPSATPDAIVHAATPASAALLADAPAVMLDTILDGGRRVGELAQRAGAVPILFTSSGAIYGTQPLEVDLMSETFGGAPDPVLPASAYAEGKRTGELQTVLAANASGGRAVIARLFAFCGPYLPIDKHFAVGNFIADALRGRPIVVNNGGPLRSYLYPTDLVSWLLAVFGRGLHARPYNIGSDEAIGISELAHRIAAHAMPPVSVDDRKPFEAGAPRPRYVPSSERIQHELGVRRRVDLDEALRRTIAWHREGK